MDFKTVLVILGIAITVISPLPYIKDISRNKTKPSVITWLIWTVLASSGFAIQLIGGGGLGSYVLGCTALLNAVILVLTLRQSKYHVSRFDMTILSLALVSLVLWRLTKSAHLSAILITFTMAMGYIPTYRKSFAVPEHETASLFFLSAIKQLVGIAALSAYNTLTLLFPGFLVLANLGLTTVILIRRQHLKRLS